MEEHALREVYTKLGELSELSIEAVKNKSFVDY